MSVLPILAVIAASFLLGSMIFFAAVTAPAVFKFLPEESAGQYLRGVFPRYYLWGTICALIAAVLSLPVSLISGGLLLCVASAFVGVRQILVPRINAAKEGRTAGDDAATARFAKLHGLSVLINLAQMIALIAVLVLLAT
jgi:hypothetical protein